MHPGQVPKAYPVIAIMQEQRTIQKYLNSGKIPFFTKLLQVTSIALANKNKAQVCLDFFSRNITEKNPAKSPAINGMNFCFSQGKCLLMKHRIPLKRATKLPKKKPKFKESLLIKMFFKWLGLANIFFKPKTSDIPDLIKYPATAILIVDTRIDQKQPCGCLQNQVLYYGSFNFRICPENEKGHFPPFIGLPYGPS